MATTPEEIQSFLDQRKLKYGHDQGSAKFQSGFRTDNYLNADGKNLLALNIFCEDNGNLVRIVTPNLFVVPASASAKRKAIIWQTLLQVNWSSRLVTFEYDASDGEVRALYSIPLGDSSLSQQQLMNGIYSLPAAVDQYAPDIVRAIDFGIPLESHPKFAAKFEKFIKNWSPSMP